MTTSTPRRKPYPSDVSDVSDEEWSFVAPYLTLLPEDAGQRAYPLREAFNDVRYIVRTGAHWRMLPHDPPPCLAGLRFRAFARPMLHRFTALTSSP